MRPEPVAKSGGLFRLAGRGLVLARAAFYQLRLEIKSVTGGRAPVLGIVTCLWFGLFALRARLRDEPWPADTYYTMMLVIPGSILVVALAMVSVIGERDTRQLETTFVSPTGRYQAWAYRFAAVLLACWGSAGLLSLLTWLIVDPGHRPLASWLHAFVPLFFATGLTVLCSIAFRSAAVAGLLAGAYLVLFGVFGDIWRAGSYWFNPFDVPERQDDPTAFFREIVFNRSGYLLAGVLLFTCAFALLQRRERLV